jgi:tetratricopeptide (TPR) repeat protein
MTAIDRRIMAAQGYLELGMHSDARDELSGLPEGSFDRADVVEITLLCLMGDQRWEEGLGLAQRLCELAPKEPGGYIHAAFCLHELGRTSEAMELLRAGPKTLRTKAVYYYNLGCYEARLGHKDEAVKLLLQSFEMDGSLRSIARKDPDLDPVRARLERT